MQRARRITHRVFAAVAALTVAACGLTQLAYNNFTVLYSNAAPMLVWAVDDYVDISGGQREWVRERLTRALAWHRRQELPGYRLFLEKVAMRFEGNFTPDEVRQSYAEMRSHYQNAVDYLLPDVADFLLQLDGEQLVQLERKFDSENRKLVKESTRGTPAERLRERARKLVAHIEEWTGELTRAQRELVEASLATSADTTSERLADRRYRQTETLALLRARPAKERTVGELRRLLVDTATWRRPEYQQKLADRDTRMFDMVATLSATLSAEQRAHLVGRLRGYIRDISTLTTSTGDRPLVPPGGTRGSLPGSGHACFLRSSIVASSCERMPGSKAECPASAITLYEASGHAWCRSSAETVGQTMS